MTRPSVVHAGMLGRLAPATFLAATWNVYNGTTADELQPLLRERLRAGVTLFLLQELLRPDVRELFRSHGLKLHHTTPQYGVAWSPHQWLAVRPGLDLTLSSTVWHTTRGHPMPTNAAAQLLVDQAGRSLLAVSYHTPAHVQVRDQPVNRVTALRDAMATLGQLRREATTTACLFGGDDNVDERGAFGPWDFMRAAATGLRLVQAPEATHGRQRRIDDFRTTGLRVLDGSVHPGGGDHRVHVRRFGWRATR